VYASHLPLGENAGDISVNVVATTGTGAVSIPGLIPRMSPEPGDAMSVWKSSHFPSGDQRALYRFHFSWSCITACAPPSSRLVHRSIAPVPWVEENVTYLPSGVDPGP